MYTTNSRSPSYLRLCKNLDSCLKDMNDCYKKLTDIQANAATTDNEKELARRFGEGWLRVCYSLEICCPRLKKESLETYILCTKADLALNNYVVRSRIFCCKLSRIRL